jgi:hypothetical protein
MHIISGAVFKGVAAAITITITVAAVATQSMPDAGLRCGSRPDEPPTTCAECMQHTCMAPQGGNYAAATKQEPDLLQPEQRRSTDSRLIRSDLRLVATLSSGGSRQRPLQPPMRMAPRPSLLLGACMYRQPLTRTCGGGALLRC